MFTIFLFITNREGLNDSFINCEVAKRESLSTESLFLLNVILYLHCPTLGPLRNEVFQSSIFQKPITGPHGWAIEDFFKLKILYSHSSLFITNREVLNNSLINCVVTKRGVEPQLSIVNFQLSIINCYRPPTGLLCVGQGS